MPLSPYFKSMAGRKRLCPQCMERATRIEPLDSGGMNAAFEVCDCGYRYLLQAPKSAWVERPAKQTARVVRVDFGKRV